ncbi:MAG: gliding motility-associated C-terminal domain-containing protein, partial [Bacteroidia bacterium]|nr:gliding motility-associated C-terminal domain-containing protein [Bacteroidia bacterium]
VYNVQINDNLANTFSPPCTFTVVPPPVSINSIVTVDPSFTGQGSNTNLLIASTSSLLPGQVDTIKVLVKFTPNGLVSFTNTAIATAGNLPSGGYTGSDVSTDGGDPDPNGNGTPSDPGEGVPTVFEVEFDFFIPQGFSPNGDGVNDLFEIRGIRFFPDNELKIINRWGNTVYIKKGYANTWDGTTEIGIEIGGNKLPEGTYYYILNLNNNTKPYTGFLYLNRGLTK